MPRFEELSVANTATSGTDVFRPVRQDGSIFQYSCADRYGLAAVRPMISIATIGTGPKGSVERNTLKVVLPVPKVDAAQVELNEKSHELVAFVSFSIPSKATLDQRYELLAMVIGALQGTNGTVGAKPVMQQIVANNEALY